MKEVYRSDAWETSMCEDIWVSDSEKGYINIIDRSTFKIEKKRKTPRDYYECIYVYKLNRVIILLCREKNSIDILNLDTLEKIESIKREGMRTYEREIIIFSQKEKTIYCIFYSVKKQKSLITKILLDEMKECVILELQGIYANNFVYDKYTDDYVIIGAQFTNSRRGKEFLEQGIWLKQPSKQIFFTEANQNNIATLQKVGFTSEQKIVYSVQIWDKNSIYYLGEEKPIAKRVEIAAFSKNGQLYAYVKKNKLYVCRYEDNQCIQETDVCYPGGDTYSLEFLGDDKYIGFRNADEQVIYQLE